MATQESIVQNYLFASPNSFDEEVFKSIESLEDACEEHFSVSLSSKKEFEVLLNLLGIFDFIEENLLNSNDFSKKINISNNRLLEFNQEEFNQFYDSWLLKTGRESSMDEYGQLVFILGKFQEWNQKLNKVVLKERP